MYKDRQKLYRRLEEKLSTKIISFSTFVYPGGNGIVAEDALTYMEQILRDMDHNKDLTLILNTGGGQILAANNIVYKLYEHFKSFKCIVPMIALSAGTIICSGASSIMMMPNANLGPVDPSINNAFNPTLKNKDKDNNEKDVAQPVNVENVMNYLKCATDYLKIDNQAVLGEIYTKLADKINPIALGEIYRNHKQIRCIIKKFLKNQIKDPEQLKMTVEFLCSDAGSHDYKISREEARTSLGLNILEPDAETQDILTALSSEFIGIENKNISLFQKPFIIENNKEYNDIIVATVEGADSQGHYYIKREQYTLKINEDGKEKVISFAELSDHKIEDVTPEIAQVFEGWKDIMEVQDD